MNIEKFKIKDLKTDPNNARHHSKKNLEAIKKSLQKFKQQKPIIISQDNLVIAGNGTLQAAIDLGWEYIDVIRSDLTYDFMKAYAIADNRSAELASWDNEILGKTLNDLYSTGFDLADIGFEDFEVEGAKDDSKEDEFSCSEESKVKIGQIYELGQHRIICADSFDPKNLKMLLLNDKIDIVFTDPPYGMKLNTQYMDKFESLGVSDYSKRYAKNYKYVENDNKEFEFDKIYELVKDIKEQFWFGADYYCDKLPKDGSWFVWNKRTTPGLEKVMGNNFELCWSKKKHKREIAHIIWSGFHGHNKKDDGESKEHPTIKPVKLIEWFFERFKGNNVLDLFLGSGSTLIACEKTNRRCFGIEIDPHYCGVIISRWEKYTGKKAQLISSEGSAYVGS